MKLLLTMNLPYIPTFGGANKANRLLAEGFVQKGHTVRTVVPALGTPSRLTRAQLHDKLASEDISLASYDGVDAFTLKGVEVHMVVESSRLRAHLIDHLGAFSPDWVLVSSEDPSQNLLDAALKICPDRVVYLAHTPSFLPFGPQAFFPSERRAKLIRQVAAIVAVSSFAQKYIREWGGIESTVIHMPVYGSGPFPQFGRFDEGFVTMVNPCQVKGVAIFTALARALPEIPFAAVPTWGTTDADRAALKSLPNVQVLEPCDEFDQILARTRVLLMPSLWQENFPLTVVEAMLRGIPVLASEVGGIPEAKLGTDFLLPVRPIEQFTERLDGNQLPVPVIPDQDITPWYKALLSLLSDRALYEHHSAAARLASAAFIAKLRVEPFEELLLRLASAVRRPANAPSRQTTTPSAGQFDRKGDRLAGLTPEQLALLQLRLLQKANSRAGQEHGAPPIRPVARKGHLPLSFAQQRLWFLNQLQPDSLTYIIPVAVRLNGPLDVVVLQRSLNTIARRHETLGTTFASIDGQPVQIISATRRLPLRLIALQALSEREREVVMHRLASAEVRRPFDLACGPLVRATLMRLDVREHVLLLVIDHIVSDAWSEGLFIQELTSLYTGFVTGQPVTLPDLPIQYADYAVWQRAWLQGAALERQLAYWKEQLASLPMLELPTDRPRPLVPSFRGARHTLMLSKPLLNAITALSQREGATVFMTLLAAWQVLLSRYSGQHDIVVGTPIANRTQGTTEKLIGFFTNTLVLRVDLGGNPMFHEALRRVRAVCLGAYAHQDMPFEQVVEALRPERDLNYHPLFQIMFVFQHAQTAQLNLPGVTLRPIRVNSGTAKFDLILFMQASESGLMASLEYSSDLFDGATARRMLDHYQTLLHSIAEHPERRIASLSLLPEAERRRMLVDWNANRRDTTQDECVHRIFEAQVKRTPDTVAVVFNAASLARGEDQTLTYAELSRRTNRLARAMQRLGVGPEALVGICMERSLELVIAVLAVLKAGGGVVALDQTYPKDRLAFMIEDARLKVLLTQTWLLKDLPDHCATEICLNSGADPDTFGQESDQDFDSQVTLDNLVYAMYTSGSTGTPKGIGVSHRAFLNVIAWQQAHPTLSAAARAVQYATFGFCVSFQEIFTTLCAGATLFMITETLRKDFEELTSFLDRQAIERLYLPFAALKHLAEVCNAGRRPAGLIEVITSGEQLHVTLPIQALLNGCRLYNQYGASETHVVSNFMLAGDSTIWPVIPPVGRPISNVQIYLLDPYLQPVPIGVPGEIHIGGPGLARGYLNDPALTATKFIPNPFGTLNDERRTMKDPIDADSDSSFSVQRSAFGERLYRTGDLGRYHPDGNIEYLGRIDQQVKIRGFRVDPGEIETILRQHPAVLDVTVIADERQGAGRQLIAYVVLHAQHQIGNELYRFLRQKVPDYMVPSAFVLLDALPLNANGKLDRQALPTPDPATTATDSATSAPQSPIEALLTVIWAGVLGRAQVDAHDNFFELGGHSLLATQLITRVRDMFHIELPLRALFEAPTPAELADRIVQAQRAAPGLCPPPLVRAVRDQPLPLSFAQQRLWFLDQLQPQSTAYLMPAAVRLSGALDVAALRRSLSEVVRRHETLRTIFVTVDGQPVQAIGSTLMPALPLIDLCALSEGQREAATLLTQAEVAQPFDLGCGPLLRAALLRLDQTEHVLLLTMHHIVSDGWSVALFITEMNTLYSAFHTGQLSPLSDLPIQYADYALWQRAWLQGTVLETELAYWRAALADLPPLQLPTDRPRPSTPTFDGRRHTFVLPPALAMKLKVLNRGEGLTLFMTLLAAFQVLLARYSSQRDIAVGTPIANRTRGETEGLIGFFVNTLVLRVDLSDDPSFHELLRRVREVCLGAYTHQDVPFEQVIEALQPTRDLSRHPLFQVMFVLQNTPQAVIEAPGLSLRPLDIAGTTTKFDLTLLLSEVEGGLSAVIEYSVDLFDAPTIARLAGHYHVLLDEVAGDPNRRLSDLTFLTASERRQLAEWNTTDADDPMDECIHQMFEAQAARTPDAVAVVFERPPTNDTQDMETRRHGDKEEKRRRTDNGSVFIVHGSSFIVQHLTYHELNRQANQLARYLRALGVGPEMRVGLCLERSPQLVIGLLAILKSGGAYVPLDPAYPPARLAFMLADSQAPILLTQKALYDVRLTIDDVPASDDQLQELKTQNPGLGNPSPSIRQDSAGKGQDEGSKLKPPIMVCLDSDQAAIARASGENLVGQVTADNLAYVIYTSGSSGTPKGVLVTHRGVCNMLASQIRSFDIQADSRVLQFASVSFDAAISEIGMALLAGATLYLEPRAALLLEPNLIQLLRERAITALTLPPSALALLPVEELPALRTLVIAGEACPADLAARWSGGRRLFNAYGPTEVSVCATIGAYDGDGRQPPIGRPIAKTQVYVLDMAGQLAPVGVPGELYIGGLGLARGYFDRPDLTAERFIPNPFAKVSGVGSQVSEDAAPDTWHPAPATRLYKTGDLARYRPDGTLEFLGRLDQQVKIRGFRVELGEVEANLRSHPAVREVAVIMRPDRSGDAHLVAYVVPSQGSGVRGQGSGDSGPEALIPDPRSLIPALRSFLAERLPEYMLPSAFVVLDALPVTPSGKIDRRGLPAPGTERPELESQFVAPRTPVEERLAQIWSQVLGIERVGVYDNFFLLGGHSLMATRIISRVRETFSVELPLRSLFVLPTVANLAERLEMLRWTARGVRLSLGSPEEDREEGEL